MATPLNNLGVLYKAQNFENLDVTEFVEINSSDAQDNRSYDGEWGKLGINENPGYFACPYCPNGFVNKRLVGHMHSCHMHIFQHWM